MSQCHSDRHTHTHARSTCEKERQFLKLIGKSKRRKFSSIGMRWESKRKKWKAELTRQVSYAVHWSSHTFFFYRISKLCVFLLLLLLFFIANKKELEEKKTYFISISMLTNWANLSIIFDLFGNCSHTLLDIRWWWWCCCWLLQESFCTNDGEIYSTKLWTEKKSFFFWPFSSSQKVYLEYHTSYLHYQHSLHSNIFIKLF